jgi:AcrR family transcriptional regulator
MSPYPAQVDREMIVNKARNMIEADGLTDLSLGKLAMALGIKAPSLYKHVASKAELLRAVNTVTAGQLVETMRYAATGAGHDPVKRLVDIAKAYRQFAHTYPATYTLAFADITPEHRPDPKYLEAMALPLQALMEPIAGREHSLAALRGAWALIHGFVMLELAGQFQRGGDVPAAFVRAVEAYATGWKTSNLARDFEPDRDA